MSAVRKDGGTYGTNLVLGQGGEETQDEYLLCLKVDGIDLKMADDIQLHLGPGTVRAFSTGPMHITQSVSRYGTGAYSTR